MHRKRASSTQEGKNIRADNTSISANLFLDYLQIVREFRRLPELATQEGREAIPTPSKATISSYTSYQRLRRRGGVPVRGQSLKDIQDSAHETRLSCTTGENESFCIKCVLECEREEPFFTMVLSTKLLLSKLESSRPLETDETFKVMHEGYPLTLLGQSDMNRVWHVR